MLTLNVYSVHLGLLLIFMKMVWCQKLLFNFDLTPDMETSDFDIPSSDLSKLIKYVVKGQTEMPSEYLSIQVGPDLIELGIEIKNSSVFVPGDDVKNSQFGFRSVAHSNSHRILRFVRKEERMRECVSN